MSLNGPQWGKRGGGNEGPPDLDEMWRNFNRKLNSLFSRRGGGPDSGEPPNMKQVGGGAGPVFGGGLVARLADGFLFLVESYGGRGRGFRKVFGGTQPRQALVRRASFPSKWY